MKNTFLSYYTLFKQLLFPQKKKVLLANCDWVKILHCHKGLRLDDFDEVDHVGVMAGIEELKAQCIGQCSQASCPEYDHTIHAEYAEAIVQMIDVSLVQMAELSMHVDSVKEEMKGFFESLPNVKGVIVGGTADLCFTKTYEHLSRIKSQLQS